MLQLQHHKKNDIILIGDVNVRKLFKKISEKDQIKLLKLLETNVSSYKKDTTI